MLLVSWNVHPLSWFTSQVELLSQKCRELKIFFPRNIILHLPQQCSIFLALRHIGDKNNFHFKQKICCFIVKCDCRNMSRKFEYSLWFLADLAMSESYSWKLRRKRMLSRRKEEGNQYDLNSFTLLLGHWISVRWCSWEFAFEVNEQ